MCLFMFPVAALLPMPFPFSEGANWVNVHRSLQPITRVPARHVRPAVKSTLVQGDADYTKIPSEI